MLRCSVIIPFFNSGRYLARCIESVVRSMVLAEGEECELILVDNGSVDDSLKIATMYKNMNPQRIRLVTCRAKGAAAARNYGLKYASGEYIWFIDADDWVEPLALKKLLDVADGRVDVVTMSAVRDVDGGGVNPEILRAISDEMDNWKDRFVMYGFGPWQYIAKRKWLEQNGLLFHEGIIHEDIALTPTFPLFTGKVGAVHEVLYHYVQHDDSVLHKTSWNDNAFDIYTALDDVYMRFVDYDTDGAFDDAVEYLYIWNLLIDTARNFAQFPEGKGGFAKSRAVLKERYPRWRENRYFKQKGAIFKLYCYMGYMGELDIVHARRA